MRCIKFMWTNRCSPSPCAGFCDLGNAVRGIWRKPPASRQQRPLKNVKTDRASETSRSVAGCLEVLRFLWPDHFKQIKAQTGLGCFIHVGFPVSVGVNRDAVWDLVWICGPCCNCNPTSGSAQISGQRCEAVVAAVMGRRIQLAS